MILETSASGEFVSYDSHGTICIARNSDTNLYALAKIVDDDIVGIQGNGGNRFERLSEIEKVDCATIIVKMKNNI